MIKKEIKFINDILKPWDELNDLLAKPYVYEPGISDIIRMATNLAIAINHWCDLEKENKKEIINLSASYKLMVDIANMVKHRAPLYDRTRENNLYAAATFEYLESGNKILKDNNLCRVC